MPILLLIYYVTDSFLSSFNQISPLICGRYTVESIVILVVTYVTNKNNKWRIVLYHKLDELMALRSCFNLTSWPIELGKDAYYVHLSLYSILKHIRTRAINMTIFYKWYYIPISNLLLGCVVLTFW